MDEETLERISGVMRIHMGWYVCIFKTSGKEKKRDEEFKKELDEFTKSLNEES